ncbi:MAG TPA: PAS domain S-box protein, partial [Rhodocyclaceae bacterium]
MIGDSPSRKSPATAAEGATVLTHSSALTHHAVRELRAILENATVGILFTRNRYVVQANPLAARMWGYRMEEFIGISGLDLHPSLEAYDEMAHDAVPVLIAGEAYRGERPMRRADGSLFWCRISAKAVDPERPREGTIWIMEDVTEDHLMRDTLDKMTRELLGIFDTSLIGIAVVRSERVARCNAFFEQLFGYAVGALIDQPVDRLFPSDDRFSAAIRAFDEDIAAGREHRGEAQMQRADGSLFWVRFSGRAFEPGNGAAGSAWMVEDISAAKAAEAQLRQALDEQQLIFDSATVGIVLTRGRRVLRANPRLAEILGIKARDFAGGDLN